MEFGFPLHLLRQRWRRQVDTFPEQRVRAPLYARLSPPPANPMISASTAGVRRYDYDDARPRLRCCSFGALSGDVEISDGHGVYRQRNDMTATRSIARVVGRPFVFLALLGLLLSPCSAKISDQRLCYDKDCSGTSHTYIQAAVCAQHSPN